MDNPFFKKNSKRQRLINSLTERQVDPFVIQEGKFDYKNLKDSIYYSDWTEESFLQNTGEKEALSHSFDYNNLKYFFVIFIFGFLLLFGRAFLLQILKNDEYLLLAEGNRLRSTNIEPKRGIVYDKKTRPLVRNSANFVLYLRPIDLPRDELERDMLLRQIAFIAEGNLEDNDDFYSYESSKFDLVVDTAGFYELKEKLSRVRIGSLDSYQPLFVADNLDYDTALFISLKSADWPGVLVSNKTGREYLIPIDSVDKNFQILGESSLSHILGYTGKINDKELKTYGSSYSLIDYPGKTGLEYVYERELKGIPGKKNIEVDALGRQKKIVNEVPAQDGYNIRLSLDLELQLKAEEILKSHLEKNKKKRASLVAIDPRDGSVLALVSLPAYDNNLFSGGISQANYDALINNPDRPLLNRAIAGEFPAGSTVKPIFATGALEEGIVSVSTNIFSSGGIRISQWFFPDWKAGGHGNVNVKSAIAWSVNTFFYYIGGGYGDFKGLGLDNLIKYSKLFGLGEKTGIDLPGEVLGFVPNREWKEENVGEPWYIGDTYHFSIGQGYLLATPIQIANYTAAIANGGTLYEPRLASEIFVEGGEVIREIKAKIIRENFIDSANLEIIREGMRDTVSYGSARLLDYLPYSSAGKTGTAQWSSVKDNHAWYVGFAPYENPEIAFAILVEEGGEGSSVATPIAYDLLNWYFREKGGGEGEE